MRVTADPAYLAEFTVADKTVNDRAPAVRRIQLLDTLRGVMVIYMVYYHTLFDLGFMFGKDWARDQFNAQPFSQMIIGCTFVGVAGMTIRFSRNPALHGSKLLMIASVVSLVTAFFFTGSGIYFGVLHLLAVCMMVYAVIGKVLERIPWIAGALISLALYLCTYWVPRGFFGIKGLFELPLPEALTAESRLYAFGFVDNFFSTVDFYPLLPWLFLFLCGCFVGRLLERDDLPKALYRDFCPPLTFIGRKSLAIYVVHQPVIYLICLLVTGSL